MVLAWAAGSGYYRPMVDTLNRSVVPAGWLDILAESEAEADAGLVISGDDIMRELRETAERLEASDMTRGATHRR